MAVAVTQLVLPCIPHNDTCITIPGGHHTESISQKSGFGVCMDAMNSMVSEVHFLFEWLKIFFCLILK